MMLAVAPLRFHTTMTRAVLLAGLICLPGCMIPYPSHEVYEGSEVPVASLQWMRPGDTTRAEVLDKLGAPDIDFVDRQTVAYAWSGQSGGVLFLSPKTAFADPIRMRRALMIRFDADNKVAAFSIISRPTEIIPYDVQILSLDAKYDDWRALLEQWLAQPGHGVTAAGPAPK